MNSSSHPCSMAVTLPVPFPLHNGHPTHSSGLSASCTSLLYPCSPSLYIYLSIKCPIRRHRAVEASTALQWPWQATDGPLAMLSPLSSLPLFLSLFLSLVRCSSLQPVQLETSHTAQFKTVWKAMLIVFWFQSC